jgi:Na+/H+ antiporter NhaD/arsenite permease-like protein
MPAIVPRTMMQIASEQLVALLIFVVTYILLATEYREATIATMAGVAAIWAFGILTPEEMISYVDMNAIGLLFGTMIMVGALSEAHFFQWLGVAVARLCRYRPTYLLIAFTLMTGGLSAILPNVTTVLFMVTITIAIAELLKLDPKPYVFSEVLASNIGGLATLIGDPPNMMIATATGFSFLDFLANLGLISLLALFISLAYIWGKFRDNMKRADALSALQEPMPLLKMPDMNSDQRLLWISLATLVCTVTLFCLQDIVGIYPTAVALLAATVLLLVGGRKMPDILRDVEWSTLLFFGSLFIVVGALEKTGWMDSAAQAILGFAGGNTAPGVSVVLWSFSLMSAFINNIPLAAAFIPVLKTLGNVSGLNVYPFWWALAAGTGLGGNGTIIGASSNVIAIGLARSKGVRITFVEFAKIGIVVLVLTTLVANSILLLKFWV